MKTLLVLSAVLLSIGQVVGQGPAAPQTPLLALTVYDGSWLITPKARPGEKATVDHLTNHCSMADAFYTCEQVVNGKPVALLVFTAGSAPGQFHSTVILPDGSPGGHPGELTIVGQHWTYLNKDDSGKPAFRVENLVKDHDHIHFEQFKAAPDGTWQKVGEGDEVRAAAA